MCISRNVNGLLLNCLFFPKSIAHNNNNNHYLTETGLVVDTVSSNILLPHLSKSFSANAQDPQEIMKLCINYTVDTVSLHGHWTMPLWTVACKDGPTHKRLISDMPPGLQALTQEEVRGL